MRSLARFQIRYRPPPDPAVNQRNSITGQQAIFSHAGTAMVGEEPCNRIRWRVPLWRSKQGDSAARKRPRSIRS